MAWWGRTSGRERTEGWDWRAADSNRQAGETNLNNASLHSGCKAYNTTHIILIIFHEVFEALDGCQILSAPCTVRSFSGNAERSTGRWSSNKCEIRRTSQEQTCQKWAVESLGLFWLYSEGLTGKTGGSWMSQISWVAIPKYCLLLRYFGIALGNVS